MSGAVSDEQPPPADAARRGSTGEDRTARDWAGSEEPEAPPDAVAEPAAADPGSPDAAPSAELPRKRTATEKRERLAAAAAAVAGPPPAPSAGAEPPAAAAEPPSAAATAEEPQRQVVRATGPARRPPMIVQGLWPALLAAALLGATAVGLLPLAVAVLGVQVFLVLGALALLDAPASGGAFLVATGTLLAADAVVLIDDGEVGKLAGVTGLGLVGALLHQLVRKGRSRVTESLADTFVVMVVAVAAACLLALRQIEGGEQVLLVSLAAAGTVLLAGRVGDQLAPRPMLAAGSTRGWPGLLLGLGAGVAAGVAVAQAELGEGTLPLRAAALLGLVVASTVATADLTVDLGAAELRAGWRDARRVAALRPTALLLPFAAIGPVALLAGRLVLP